MSTKRNDEFIDLMIDEDGYLQSDGGETSYESRVTMYSKPSGRLAMDDPDNRYLTLRIQKSPSVITNQSIRHCEAAIYLDQSAIEELIAHLTAARDHLAAHGNWENL